LEQHNPQYEVFLSHNSRDKPAVEVLASRLRDDKVRVFFDKWHLVPGATWQDSLNEALKSSASVAIMIGPDGDGPWQREEMQMALIEAVRNRDDYRVIPVLLPGASAAQVEGFLELRTWVDFRSDLNDDIAYRRLVAGIRGEPPEEPDYELPDPTMPLWSNFNLVKL
jgi:hypothetical protein